MLSSLRIACANGATTVLPLLIQVIANFVRQRATIGSLRGSVVISPPLSTHVNNSAGFPVYVYPVVISFPTALQKPRVDSDGVPCANGSTVVFFTEAWQEQCAAAAAALTATLDDPDVNAELLTAVNAAKPADLSPVTSITFSAVRCFKAARCD
jgi:Mlc titration factor MtfA (ptsG expression regulator)